MTYDSKQDTIEHIEHVQGLMMGAIFSLTMRAAEHDASKLLPPEKELRDQFGERLKQLPLDSPEMMAIKTAMAPAYEHHYANNGHHPEAHSNGIAGMDLLDLIEMICDWVASAQARGGPIKIGRHCQCYNISPQLKSVLLNTIKHVAPDIQIEDIQE